jgi:hypothetical protein
MKPSSDVVAEKIQHYVDKLPDILDSFEQSHPEWRSGVMMSLLQLALSSLRGYIEREQEPEITWENPYVEIQFPVQIQCSSADQDEGPLFTVTTGRLTSADVVDDIAATKALSRLMVRHLEIETLQELTQGAALIKDGDGFLPAMPEEVGMALSGIDDEVERERELRRFLQPRSFGAGTIDYGEFDLESDEPTAVPAEVLEQLGAIEQPLIDIPMNVDGNPIRLITIFEVHPLVVDRESQTGYFPIVVGLAIQSDAENPPGPDWLDQPWASLDKWEQKDRALIWNLLDQIIEKVFDQSGFCDKPEIEEAILTVNATIKVAVPKSGPHARGETLKLAMNALGEIGEIAMLNFEWNNTNEIANKQVSADEWQRLLVKVETAESSKDKGDALEELMNLLFSSIPGFEVSANVETRTEEIDLWIENECSRAPFSREGPLILVECKNWSGRAGKNEFVQLREKARNRRGRCSLAFLVSWNGSAKTIGEEMLRNSSENLLIVPLDGEMIKHAIQDGDFWSLLRRAHKMALAI